MKSNRRISLTVGAFEQVAALSHIFPWKVYRTFVKILQHAEPDSYVKGCLVSFVTQKALAAEVGYPERTVRNYINTLAESGVIQKVWKGPGGNRYRFSLPLPDHILEDIASRIPAFKAIQGELLVPDSSTSESHAAEAESPRQDLTAEETPTEPVSELCDNMEVTEPQAPSAPVLDPDIEEAVGIAEERSKPSNLTRFLEHLECGWFANYKFKVDRSALLRHLLQHDANSIEGLGNLVSEFVKNHNMLDFATMCEESKAPVPRKVKIDKFTVRAFRTDEPANCPRSWGNHPDEPSVACMACASEEDCITQSEKSRRENRWNKISDPPEPKEPSKRCPGNYSFNPICVCCPLDDKCQAGEFLPEVGSSQLQ